MRGFVYKFEVDLYYVDNKLTKRRYERIVDKIPLDNFVEEFPSAFDGQRLEWCDLSDRNQNNIEICYLNGDILEEKIDYRNEIKEKIKQHDIIYREEIIDELLKDIWIKQT